MSDGLRYLFGLLWRLKPGGLEPDVLRLGADLAALHDEVPGGLHLTIHLLQAGGGDPGRRVVRVRLPAPQTHHIHQLLRIHTELALQNAWDLYRFAFGVAIISVRL